MNERIKELYDQASIRYSVYEILKPRDERKSIPDIFAELIVQKCMACSTWVGNVNKTAIEPIHTAHTINQRIKEHFGVEE